MQCTELKVHKRNTRYPLVQLGCFVISPLALCFCEQSVHSSWFAILQNDMEDCPTSGINAVAHGTFRLHYSDVLTSFVGTKMARCQRFDNLVWRALK